MKDVLYIFITMSVCAPVFFAGGIEAALSAGALALALAAVGSDSGSSEKLRLREQARIFDLISKTARIFVNFITCEGILSYVNDYILKASGYGREELIGSDFRVFLAPDSDRETIDKRFEEVKEGKTVTNIEARLFAKSGEIIETMWNFVPVIESDGKVCMIVASGIDITDLKRTQSRLEESEARYRALVEKNLAGVVIIKGARVVYANRRSQEITGYTLEDSERMNFWEFIHPDDRGRVIELAKRRLRGEAIREPFEIRMITKTGKTKVVEGMGAVIDYEGEKSILMNIIDVTERKDTERQKNEFYKHTITAVTQGKLEILDPDEIAECVKDPDVRVEIAEPRDVGLSRRRVAEFASEQGLKERRLDEFVMAFAEAGMNALKHAGGGIALAGRRDDTVWSAVMDMGAGMDSLVLTQAVLRKGFSTKPSLGFGYTFILEFSDRVFLSTTPTGTSVVMEKSIKGLPPIEQLDVSRLPDVW